MFWYRMEWDNERLEESLLSMKLELVWVDLDRQHVARLERDEGAIEEYHFFPSQKIQGRPKLAALAGPAPSLQLQGAAFTLDAELMRTHQ